jgi:hypothetical protein
MPSIQARFPVPRETAIVRRARGELPEPAYVSGSAFFFLGLLNCR